ncbi:MAG: PD-(D/E)XK nuclease family protein [Ruthenibacterium lactatiformans]
MSAAMEPLVEALAPPADVLDEAQRAPTPAAALDLLGAAYREDTPQTAALEAALRRQDTMAESLAAMERAARPAHFFARETRPLGALLGDRLTLSPTRVEQYYRCRFSYFLQYVLRIRPRRRAELSPLESGSLVHYILEHVKRSADAEFRVLRRRSWPGWPARWPTNTWPKTCPPQGGACPPGGTAEARRNAFVGVSSGGAGPKPVPSGRL